MSKDSEKAFAAVEMYTVSTILKIQHWLAGLEESIRGYTTHERHFKTSKTYDKKCYCSEVLERAFCVLKPWNILPASTTDTCHLGQSNRYGGKEQSKRQIDTVEISWIGPAVEDHGRRMGSMLDKRALKRTGIVRHGAMVHQVVGFRTVPRRRRIGATLNGQI